MSNKIRMTVEFEIDQDFLNETGITVSDVKKGITFQSDDVVDGFLISTDIPGYNRTNDFFLCNGVVLSKELVIDRDLTSNSDKELTFNSRLAELNEYKKNEEILKADKEKKLDDERAALIRQIKAFEPRIKALIETGNACLKNGVEIDKYKSLGWNRSYDNYENGTFVTNGISHRLGFVVERGMPGNSSFAITKLGINAGGACGPLDFRTDGLYVYSIHEDKHTIHEPNIKDMKAFLERFDEFEEKFYSYIDKVIEAQKAKVAVIQKPSIESQIHEANSLKPTGLDEKILSNDFER